MAGQGWGEDRGLAFNLPQICGRLNPVPTQNRLFRQLADLRKCCRRGRIFKVPTLHLDRRKNGTEQVPISKSDACVAFAPAGLARAPAAFWLGVVGTKGIARTTRGGPSRHLATCFGRRLLDLDHKAFVARLAAIALDRGQAALGFDTDDQLHRLRTCRTGRRSRGRFREHLASIIRKSLVWINGIPHLGDATGSLFHSVERSVSVRAWVPTVATSGTILRNARPAAGR